jgi:hypothetical protein
MIDEATNDYPKINTEHYSDYLRLNVKLRYLTDEINDIIENETYNKIFDALGAGFDVWALWKTLNILNDEVKEVANECEKLLSKW